MARVVKLCREWWRVELAADADGRGSLGCAGLSGSGRQAYLWVGGPDGICAATFTGPVALHALADAIKKHVPAPKRRARRAK